MGYVPTPWMTVPFGVLLLAIALGPLIVPHWWARHYPKVALSLALPPLIYYLFVLPAAARPTVLHTAEHYFSFIVLIGSLFVVSGGIHITVKGEATPRVNVVFLLIGAVIANLLGTTGASMLLIRPWLRMNYYRVTGFHVVFFIFIVSNVGGCLTPIGDPPLFLGYLLGVPFWWVAEHCWPIWAVAIGALLAIFYLLDSLNYRRAPQRVREAQTEHEQWRFEGLTNLFFLAVVLVAVFLEHPKLLREGLMIGAAVGSWFTTPPEVHQANHFNFHPIQEVAILFAGIFAAMMPALDWLQVNAGQLIHPTPAFFYWTTGALSSVLDNAPTYYSFLSALFGTIDPQVVAQVQGLVNDGGASLGELTGRNAEFVRRTVEALQRYHATAFAAKTVTREQIEIAYLVGNPQLNAFLIAISTGAVFFGAATYIGNGPNFMVKSIAEQRKVATPSFPGYVLKYTLPLLLPMLLLVWLVFFRQ